MDCGIITGNLFDPVGRSQLSLETIEIVDGYVVVQARKIDNAV